MPTATGPGRLSVSCLRRPDGELELFVAQFIDVTTEVELRAQQAELRRPLPPS